MAYRSQYESLPVTMLSTFETINTFRRIKYVQNMLRSSVSSALELAKHKKALFRRRLPQLKQILVDFRLE